MLEICVQRLVPGAVAEAEKRFGEALAGSAGAGELVGFWHTEVGDVNDVVHVWRHDGDAIPSRGLRSDAASASIDGLVLSTMREWIEPFAFVPALAAGKHGPIYELRCYILKPGTLADQAAGWEKMLPKRLERAPVVFAGGVRAGRTQAFYQLWAYASFEDRLKIRAETRKEGIWPPPGGPARALTQENSILLPAAFSPLQ